MKTTKVLKAEQGKMAKWKELIDKVKKKENLVTKEDFKRLHENAKESEQNAIRACTMARNYQVR